MTQRRDGPSSASVERARAERHKLRQRAIRRGASAGHGRVHPSKSEARGFRSHGSPPDSSGASAG
jgi:hypothetical protein